MAGDSDKKSTQAPLLDRVHIGPWVRVPRKDRSPFAHYPRDVEGFVARYLREHPLREHPLRGHKPHVPEPEAPAPADLPVFASPAEARAAYGAALTEALQVLGMPLGEIEGMNHVMDLLPRGMAEKRNLRGICAGNAPLWPYTLDDLHTLMQAAMEARKEHTHRGPERVEDVDWAKLTRLAEAVSQQVQHASPARAR